LSSTYQRYYGPLRLPGQPDGDFSVRLIRRGWTPVIHWPGSPVVPSGAVLACHPCYPGGPPVTWQRWGSPERRSSSPDNGVDALTEVHEAISGFAARYGLRGCALTSVSARQGTWCSGLPRTPPSSYPGALPAPGAGLSPASSRVSTAYCPVPIYPGPDFHRRVPEYPRHTVRYLFTPSSTQSAGRVLSPGRCVDYTLETGDARRMPFNQSRFYALFASRGFGMNLRGALALHPTPFLGQKFQRGQCLLADREFRKTGSFTSPCACPRDALPRPSSNQPPNASSPASCHVTAGRPTWAYRSG
jgi:hypothetical protein